MIVKPKQLRDRVYEYHKKGLPSGFSTGWRSLDPYYNVNTGELTLVTGIPGHGKSEWLDALMVNLARNHNYAHCVFSPENYPMELHVAKLLEKYLGKTFSINKIDRINEKDLEKGIDFLDKHFYFLKANFDDTFNLESLLLEAKAFLFGHDNVGRPHAMVIDPWNELDHYRPANLTETEYISQSLSVIRRYAREFKFHIWLVAHPTKLRKQDDGNYPVPTPYDISGSAHWRNKADNCITIWRDLISKSPEVQIHIQKIKFKNVGTEGVIALKYNRETGQYIDTKLPDYARVELNLINGAI